MIDCRLIYLIVLSSTCFAWILAQQHHSAAIAIPHYIKYPNQQQIPTRVLHKPVLTATIPSGFRFSTTENSIPISFGKGHQQYPYHKPQAIVKQENEDVNEEKEEEEAEKQEPDRLNQLLLNSKFDCTNRKTGYYADEGLDCEVFHYCQENVRHSWICPDGFTFHQVHLICMPPEGDNICKKSSKYYFVNDYLYKPINAEEVQRRPNTTIKYSERYFPESEEGEIENKNNRHYQTYDSDNDDDTDEDENKNYLQNGRKLPVNVAFQTSPRPQSILGFSRPHSVQFVRNVNFQPQHGQVFRSPEEVNISLQQRKPALFAQRSISISNADDDNDN